MYSAHEIFLYILCIAFVRYPGDRGLLKSGTCGLSTCYRVLADAGSYYLGYNLYLLYIVYRQDFPYQKMWLRVDKVFLWRYNGGVL